MPPQNAVPKGARTALRQAGLRDKADDGGDGGEESCDNGGVRDIYPVDGADSAPGYRRELEFGR
ncbi:hypothetical protein GCM10023196_062520 [Actinoallomurus vinaceus]|uniref:Uncharacterized protein n=1 Tax=Actinoallomurus vinaceus TaxID=1080074 RepID=A0ABP8UGP2_9ACTN